MSNLPKSAYKYFWDIDAAELNVSKHSRFVIERLLEYADFPELRWMLRNFDQQEILDVLKKSRSLSPRSANFWSLILNIPKRDMLSLNKKIPVSRNSAW